MKKHLILFSILFSICFITNDLKAQIDSLDLSEIKELLSGKWKRKGEITKFSFGFDNDSIGSRYSEGFISTAPLFKIYKVNDQWHFGSIDILGSGDPHPYGIIKLDKKKFIIRDCKNKTRIKYLKK